MTITFRHFSSAVHCRPVGRHGVIEVRGTGPFLQDTYERFRPLVLDHIKHAPAAVVRLDTALHLMTDPPSSKCSQYHPTSPPQAIVVMDQDLALWMQHALNLWDRWGEVRTVWPTGQAERAYQWADQIAQARPQEPQERSPEVTGPSPLS